MAESGQICSQVRQARQLSGLILTAGVLYTPKSSLEKESAASGQLAIHNPQPLHKPSKVVQEPFFIL